MKKKIKDLTLEEIREICRRNYCEYCPLENTEKCLYFNESLNNEVEIDE